VAENQKKNRRDFLSRIRFLYLLAVRLLGSKLNQKFASIRQKECAAFASRERHCSLPFGVTAILGSLRSSAFSPTSIRALSTSHDRSGRLGYAAGTHLLRLINEILDLSKIEAGKLELNVEAVDLARLIDEVIGHRGTARREEPEPPHR